MWHGFMDQVLVLATSLSMGSRKFFSRSISGPSWSRQIESLNVVSSREGQNGDYALALQSLAGPLDPGYKIAQWKGAQFPTVVFHHEHLETPFDFSPQANNTFKNLFLWNQPPVEANLVVVRAPFHQGGWPGYLEQIVDLSHYMAMLAGSAAALEHVLQACRRKKNERVYLAGAGLGGWAVNLHRAFFNTATGYIPLLAGAALEDVFLKGLYRRLTGALALEYPDALRQALNFETSFKRPDGARVFPLLARHDRIVRWERQQTSYAPGSLSTLPKGHMTAYLTPALLRQHILKTVLL